MSDDTVAGSWVLHLSIIIKDDLYDGELNSIAHALVHMCARAGYAFDVIDHNINEDGYTSFRIEVPFDTLEDEDPGMVSLSIIEDIQYHVPYEVVGDEITGDEIEG